MILEKRNNLKPILESCKGIHLSSYIVNRGDLDDFNRQIQETINRANRDTQNVMGLKERIKFLEPIISLIGEERILNGFKGNIAIFRTKNSFWILNIPIDVEELSVVATTFHVKPLLKWMQIDREFLLLGLEEDGIYLYQGSNYSLKPVCSYKIDQYKESTEMFFSLNETINEITKTSGIRVFVAGDGSASDHLFQHLDYENISRLPFWPFFEQQSLEDICLDIRSYLREEAREALDQSLVDFNFAADLKIANRNIFEIAEAAVQGRVRKLLIADDEKIFGKLNLRNGGLAFNLYDRDHEDDDLLDDIAQTVLAQGGEVSIVPKDQIPFGRSALAILDNEKPELRPQMNIQVHTERRVI